MNEPVRRKEFELESKTSSIKIIREEIRLLLKEAGLPSKLEESILVALGEAFTNSIRHSYEGREDQKVRVLYEETPEKIVLHIRDFGKKIDLSKVKKPVLPPETPGGLGIHFMETIMDRLEYNTGHAEGNELILTKYKPSKEIK